MYNVYTLKRTILGLIILLVVMALVFVAWRKPVIDRLVGEKNPKEVIEQLVTPTQQFVLMGDVGTAASQQYEVAREIQEKCEKDSNCQAVFILGDIIYEEGISSARDPQLDLKLEEPYKNIELPFYLALGNHDYVGCEECFLEYAANNSKWKFPSRYYKQAFDEVEFFVIDTEQFDSEQRLWLQNELAVSTKRWKIVLGHRPIISEEESKKGENWNGKQELEDIVCQAADFYVSGHAHLLEDRGTLSECKTKLLISGSGGSHVREIAEPFTGTFYAEENGFLSLSISNSKAAYIFVDKAGNVLYQSD